MAAAARVLAQLRGDGLGGGLGERGSVLDLVSDAGLAGAAVRVAGVGVGVGGDGGIVGSLGSSVGPHRGGGARGGGG